MDTTLRITRTIATPPSSEGLPRYLKIWLYLYLVPVILFVGALVSVLVVCG